MGAAHDDQGGTGEDGTGPANDRPPRAAGEGPGGDRGGSGLTRSPGDALPAAGPSGGPAGHDRGDRAAAMPGWLPRAFALALALVGAYQLLSWAFLRTLGLLLNVLIAFFLALAMEPAVAGLARRGMRRGAATALVSLVLLLAAAGFFYALGSLFAEQVSRLAENFPRYVTEVVRWSNQHFHTDLDVDELRTGFVHSDWVRGYLRHGAQNVWGASATVLGGVFQLLTVALFTFYFAADGPRLRLALCSVLPPARQAEVLRAWEIAVTKTGGYIYSRALMALVSAVAHYVFLVLMDIPYAAALGVWVGVVSQFVPTVGTYIAGALPLLIAFTVDPWSALWVLVFIVLYQQFENYVLQPRITARTVDIHPAVAFGTVIAGTALFGAVGALVAIPATATLQGFLSAYVKRYDVPRAEGAGGGAPGGGEPGRGEAGDGGPEGGSRGGAGRRKGFLRRSRRHR